EPRAVRASDAARADGQERGAGAVRAGRAAGPGGIAGADGPGYSVRRKHGGGAVVSKFLVGVDLGGTNLRAAVVTQDKKVLARDTTPTHAEKGPEAVMEAIREGVEDAVRAAGLERRDLLAVGIGAPGPMNWQTGVVYDPPNLPGWKNVPLADEMRKRLGVPCFVEND